MIGQQHDRASFGGLRWLAMAVAIALSILLMCEGHPVQPIDQLSTMFGSACRSVTASVAASAAVCRGLN
jgi:hypothetical protein